MSAVIPPPPDTSGVPKSWHPQQEKVLKVWGEQAACYRHMHYKSYQKFKKLNINFTLPVIILSTITGTANFAQDTFPPNVRPYAPVVIGGLNLVAAIMSTIAQFLKISSLMEMHRTSSVDFGKLSRAIRLQLSLPIFERTYQGGIFLDTCRIELDRLIDQCPPISANIIKSFEREFPSEHARKMKETCFASRLKSYFCVWAPSPSDGDDGYFVNLDKPEIIKLTEIITYNGDVEAKLMEKGALAFKRHQHRQISVPHPPLTMPLPVPIPPPPPPPVSNVMQIVKSFEPGNNTA